MKTIIFYHGKCFDGFGGAYAAWKKFADAAEYVPLSRDEEPPYEMARGAETYFIDFCYPKEEMEQFAALASRLVVLDHHEGVEDVITSFPEHVYDSKRSGARIAWDYFHPHTPAPQIVRYVEDGDLYRFSLPDARPILTYLYTKEQDFVLWNDLERQLQDPEERVRIVERGTGYAEYAALLVERLVKRAKLVSFEGYICYLGLAGSMFTSDVGNALASMRPPFALVVNPSIDGFRVSLRRAKGDESVDLAKIAQKYGGNGHPFAAAFSLPWGSPLPWTLAENEDSRD
jgi:uncharacterized protein